MTVNVDQIYTRVHARADAAVEAGVQYLNFSTYLHTTDTEEYIRSLPIESAFFAPGSFMQNYLSMWAPYLNDDGAYAINNIVSPQAPLPLIDTLGDTGKYVGAILAEPDKYKAKVFSAATGLYSSDEVSQAISKVTGKVVKYNQMSVEVFRSLMPPAVADDAVPMNEVY
ncbi:hypothetical protein BG006_003817 [Podila minutissima]|uniref:NmrA-like domain-containing protein n=1 Tax=Podila minutissima TaxID=64525 RepID=A0A9P5SM29_9FUNG|nr:hypothetical protein BG006_003817 [Podila minutissima]